MNRKHLLFATILLLLFSFACSKEVEETPPPEPEVVETTEPEEVKEPEPPPVQEVDEPDELSDFDISKIDMQRVHFDFDKAELRPDAIAVLNRHAETLRANEEIAVLVEGHCDERGTEDYNLGLGERRANRVKEYLTSQGINAGRISTISYGELRPLRDGHNEAAWAENRRAEFKLSKRK